MIQALISRMIEGLFQPRQAAARILAGNHGADAAVLFLVLAYLIQAMLQILLLGAREQPEGAASVPAVAFHLLNIVLQAAMAGIISLLIFGIGRVFGGTGSRLQAFVLVAWHTLVTTVLSPVFLIGMGQLGAGEISGAVLGLMVVAVSIWLWVLAVYTAVLHRFRSPWGVMGVMVGLSFLLSSLFMAMIPAA